MSEKEEFDWSGTHGDEYADWNPTDPAGVDRLYESFYGKTATEIVAKVMACLTGDGLDVSKARAFDIGCNTGGMLSVLEAAGFAPSNLGGVDLSPAAIEKNRKAHPKYDVNVVKSFEYEPPKNVDMVYHTGVLCQIPQEDYASFFGKVKEIDPKFYMFIEGINPRGYEKIPNSAAHGHHHDGHSEKHEEHHKKEKKEGQGEHHEGEEYPHEGDVKAGMSSSMPMDEGFHYTNDHAVTVKAMFPDAKVIFSEKLEYTEESRSWFLPLHMDYTLCNVYQLRK